MTELKTGPRAAKPLRPDRVYLGWQYALRHPDPGPRPRRPTPAGQHQLNPGWVAAQRREDKALNRPTRLACGGAIALAALLLALWLAGLLNPLIAGPGIGACLLGAGLTAHASWQAGRALDGRIAAEKRRLEVIRAEMQSRLFASQEEHARAFQDWQARRAAYERQLQWYAVSLPTDIDRVDLAGGTISGWSAVATMLGAGRLSTGGEVTVIDLSEGAVAEDLATLSRRWGIDPLVWLLPADLPQLDLGTGLGAAAMADVLALVVNVGEDQSSTRDLAYDSAILERLIELLGDPRIENMTAALRALAQIGDPREDIRRGLIGAGQVDEIGRLFGRTATDRVVIERAWALESQLRKLEKLGTEPSGLPPGRLRVLATDPRAGVLSNRVLGTYVVTALTHTLRQAHAASPGALGPWQHVVLLAGAERLRGDVLDRLCDACETTGTGLVLGYRSIPATVRERIGRGNAAVAFMRLGNADDAKAAAEQIGTEHRFVLSQLTETVGTSVTDTIGDSYTSTVGTADSVSVSESASETSGRSRGAGRSEESTILPFAHSTQSRSRDSSYSYGTSDSETITEGINTSSAWGVSTSRAVGVNESLARSSQRSREFLVEQHELQRLPPTALIVSHAGAHGRRVVLADANPAILGLPTATVLSLEEAAGEPSPTAAADAWYGQHGGQGAAGGGQGAAAAGRRGVPAAGGQPRAVGDPAKTPAPGQTRPAAPGWPGRKAATPVSWTGKDQPPPNLGPPPDQLDWRKPRD